jgi:hypothetical protein
MHIMNELISIIFGTEKLYQSLPGELNASTCSSSIIPSLHENEGRAIAQTVSRRLPTAAARVQTRVWSCGIL